MVALKALSVVVAGFLSLLALGFMVREMQAVKVKARTRQAPPDAHAPPPPGPAHRRLLPRRLTRPVLLDALNPAA